MQKARNIVHTEETGQTVPERNVTVNEIMATNKELNLIFLYLDLGERRGEEHENYVNIF